MFFFEVDKMAGELDSLEEVLKKHIPEGNMIILTNQEWNNELTPSGHNLTFHHILYQFWERFVVYCTIAEITYFIDTF